MGEALILLATNFLWGAYHAVQPGHGWKSGVVILGSLLAAARPAAIA